MITINNSLQEPQCDVVCRRFVEAGEAEDHHDPPGPITRSGGRDEVKSSREGPQLRVRALRAMYLEQGGEAREGVGAREQPGRRGHSLRRRGVQPREMQQHDLHV